MNRWSNNAITGIGCSLALLALCAVPDKNAPVVSSFSGTITVSSKSGPKPVNAEQLIMAGDTLSVGDKQSKLIVKFSNGAKLYLNAGSVIVFESVKKDFESVKLLRGECFSSPGESSGGTDTMLIKTLTNETKAASSDFSLYYNDEVKEFIVTVLSGVVESGKSGVLQQIPPCTRYSQVENESGQVQPPSVGELERLKMWVDASIIDSILLKSGCTLQTLSSENLPPQWTKLPQEAARVKEPYTDTIAASDPEGHPVHYQIVKAPEGMSVDGAAGIISFIPKEPGVNSIIIEAIDSDKKTIQHEFILTISDSKAAVVSLHVPGIVPVSIPVTISAKVKGDASQMKGAMYRFDTDGDGTFDIPESGAFGKLSVVKKQLFAKEGVFTVKTEVKLSDGTIVNAAKKVIVNAPPVASLVVKPEFAPSGAPVTIDASASSDSRDQPGQLRMRFDMNGDGTWDIPSGSGFTGEHSFPYSFSQNGTIKVIVQVYDEQGLWDTATATVSISRVLAIKSMSGPDTANVGDSLQFAVNIDNAEFPVASYSWVVNGPEAQSPPKSGKQCWLSFSKEGVYTISCTVVDTKNQTASASRGLVVVNSGTMVDAGGPYTVSVNSSLTITGKASDQDSKIVQYSWDFDRDGKVDAQSDSDASAKWTFTKSGIKTVLFTVKTQDGKETSDEANVDVQNTEPTVEAGQDILARSGKKVKLKGVAADPEKNIIEYAWDFDNNGTFDWTSKDTGLVEHTFKEYATAKFRVTDSDGAFAVDSIKVVVCPEGMETVENGKFCIDTYEYPNKNNAMPSLDVTYETATQICKDQGKRLCTAQEWEIACRSDEEKWKYPYGKHFQLDKCNNLGNGISKNKPAISGTFPDCVGSTGALDMSGNASEWVDAAGGNPYVYGGSWQNGEEGSKCNSMVQLERGKKYFYVGFRCCK